MNDGSVGMVFSPSVSSLGIWVLGPGWTVWVAWT